MPEPFGGRIGRTVADSEPWWPAPPRPPAGSPNVVVVVLDDVGFAQLGCFGASIRTPGMDAVAAAGLRYANFHATGLCSTTRTCLLTGRNHHGAGVGFLADFDSGYPSYRGAVDPAAGTIAEMLSEQGFGTYAAGKWHLTPPSDMTAAGPFRQWPTGRGFDRYYGFLWGEDDQWAPDLWSDQHHVEPTSEGEYHLSEDLVDRACSFIGDHVSATPDRPFLLYLAFGACHAPHQAPREFLDRYVGAFDHGWDVEREQTIARQIASGLVPPDTRLAPRNPGVPAWDDLDERQQRLYARMYEVFAGFMEHTDAQIGRLMAYLDRYDLADDTLVMIVSDNGASGEGGPNGLSNEYRYFLGLDETFEETYEHIDELGGPATHNHYPAGWAQAGNTPLKYYKKYTFGGGVRTPLIMRWPGRVPDPGSVRSQFHHAIDLTPTILDACSLATPEVLRGVPQLPMDGVSMLYTLDQATAVSRRGEQYFETVGYRGFYRDGLKIVANHEPGTAFDDDTFELYDLTADFSETADLSVQQAETTAELVAAWWEAARRYRVLPLDDRMGTRVVTRDPATDRPHWRLLPGARLSNGPAGPNFAGRDFMITARIDPGAEPVEGVLLAYGRRAAGFSFFVADAVPTLDLNLAGHHVVARADRAVGASTTELRLRLARDGEQTVAAFRIDGEPAGQQELPSGMPAGLGCLSLQCGHNSPSPVSPLYEPPFALGPRLVDVVIDLSPPTTDDPDAPERAFAAAMGME